MKRGKLNLRAFFVHLFGGVLPEEATAHVEESRLRSQFRLGKEAGKQEVLKALPAFGSHSGPLSEPVPALAKFLDNPRGAFFLSNRLLYQKPRMPRAPKLTKGAPPPRLPHTEGIPKLPDIQKTPYTSYEVPIVYPRNKEDD